jgi:outer membrane protein TolC
MRHVLFLSIILLVQAPGLHAQTTYNRLSLTDAIKTAMANYSLLQAKQNYANASAEGVRAAQKDALPDFTIEAENAYGTLNGMNGLSSGQTGVTTLTSGPVTTSQNWNAAFGALYVTNIDWNIYSFGMQRAHVEAARGQNRQDLADLKQEQFQQQVRVAGAYLDLLSAQRLRMSMEDNLVRSAQLRAIILRRTENGLNPGVDSSIADAEVSKARLSLIDAENYVQSKASQLSTQMGVTPQLFILDTSFSTRLPRDMPDSGGLPGSELSSTAAIAQHPVLQFMDSRIKTSNLLADYIHKTGLPRFTLFGVGQERGSGFGGNYASNQADYSTAWFQGINPIRTNYLVGIGVTWDLTDFARVRSRTASQNWQSAALVSEYHLEQNKLVNQWSLADQQIKNALLKYTETQALYENGLATIVDVAQTLYILNRAEIDRNVACDAVWQALLFKASTAGDMNLFLNQQ